MKLTPEDEALALQPVTDEGTQFAKELFIQGGLAASVEGYPRLLLIHGVPTLIDPRHSDALTPLEALK